jgi:hypothetical protein
MTPREKTFTAPTSKPAVDGSQDWRHVFWLVFLIAPSVVWIYRDHSVWPWDQSWYAEVATDLWFWLGHSLRNWAITMSDGLNLKPPGVSWIGQFFVPLAGVFGSVERALLFSILLTQFAWLSILLRIGQEIAPGRRVVAAAGVLLAAASQLFVGLSHQMFVEPLQTAAVAWVFYVAARAVAWPKAKVIIHLAAACILGLLAKATTPVYCVVPCLYCGYLLLRTPKRPDFRAAWADRPTRALILVCGVLGLMCGLWYVRHLGDVWQHVHDSSSGEVALDYGSRDTVPHKLTLWSRLFVQSFLTPLISWGFLALIVAAGISYAVGRRAQNSGGRHSGARLALLSVLQIGLILFVFSLNVTVEPRYMLSLLPCAAIIAMQLCAFLPARLVAVFLVLGVAQWGLVNGSSLGIPIGFTPKSQWLGTTQADRSRYEELQRAVEMTDMPGRYNIVGVEKPWLNANSAAFFAAKHRLRIGNRGYYTSLGYAQQDTEDAMRRIDSLQPPYIITLAEDWQTGTPDYVNRASLPVLKRIQRNPEFATVPFESQTGIVIFRFRADSAASSISARPPADPSLPPESISSGESESRGKSSLGWINGKLPAQDQRGRTFTAPGGALKSCLGWAFDEATNSTPEEVWLEFTDASNGRRYYWKAVRYSRPELGEAFHIPSIGMAGFRCEGPGIRLPSGTYRARIYQTTGKIALVSELNTYEPSPQLVVR